MPRPQIRPSSGLLGLGGSVTRRRLAPLRLEALTILPALRAAGLTAGCCGACPLLLGLSRPSAWQGRTKRRSGALWPRFLATLLPTRPGTEQSRRTRSQQPRLRLQLPHHSPSLLVTGGWLAWPPTPSRRRMPSSPG